MRDFVFAPIFVGLAAWGLLHPWLGVLGWTWISIMNPHAYSWTFSQLPVAAAVAITTLLGVLLTRDRRNFFVTREIVVLMMFMLWVSITLLFAMSVDEAFSQWTKVMKIDGMILAAMVVLYSRKHITLLVWVLAVSIGFYGVKGGLFTLATGGNYHVWGPGGFIAGNNEIALALVMIIPLMRFLQLTTDSTWIKRGLLLSMLLCAVAAIGSLSRGAVLAIAAMGAVFWWRSERKIPVAGLMILASVMLLLFMPDEWWARMQTITNYQDDASANGRINAWWMAWNLAKANFFGGGFEVTSPEAFARYAPNPTDIHAAHSIYFMVLGEHGFVGLFLFLLLWFFVWRSADRLRIQGKKLPQTRWLSTLGAMCQVSLAGYAVGGAFLSLSYYDLPYNILALVVLGCRWMDGQEWVKEDAEQAQMQAAIEAKAAKRAQPPRP